MTFVFYLDFRCPFCFAQLDRLQSIAHSATVEPRIVRHDREIVVPALEPDERQRAAMQQYLTRLEAEQFAVPALTLWPNTRAPSLWLAAATAREPDRALKLAHALYVALWREGRDISQDRVAERVARTVCTSRLRLEGSEPELIAQWQRSFEKLPSAKTPMIQSPHGATLQGIIPTRRLEAFLRSGRLSDAQEDVC
ncbi:MAG: DsbA family protein [Deltaproteobacteria bacterium]|nr:DsbA family protein [Deltaproteobacteria bacterium]